MRDLFPGRTSAPGRSPHHPSLQGLLILLCTLSVCVACSAVPQAGSAVQVATEAPPPDVRPAPPSDPRAYYHFLLGYMAELKQEPSKAIAEYQAALRGDPDSVFLKVRVAALFFSKGEIVEAVRYADRIAESGIHHAQTLSLLAGIYAGAGQGERALSLYDRAIAADPQRADSHFSKGVLLVNLKRLEEAELAFKQGIEQAQDSPVGYYYLGRIGVDAKQPERAISHFERAISLNPSFEPAYTALASVYESLEKWSKAAAVYRRYLEEINPHSKEARHHLVRLYISDKAYAEALAEVDKILRQDPDDLDARLRAGLIYAEMKEYSRAIEELKTILASRPTELRVRDYLGLIYEETKEYDKAIGAYEHNLKLQPSYVDGHLHMGFLLYRLKRYPDAITHLTEAINLNPKKADAHLLLGLTYLQTEEYGVASKTFEQGIQHNPENADLHFNLGTAYDKLNRFDDLVTAMETTLRLNPKHADALNYLGYSYAERGIKIEEALALIQKALSLKPNNGYYVDSLGWALFKLGRHAEALTEIQRAATLVGDDPVIFEHLGEIFLVQNRLQEAKEAWLRSLELDPTNVKLIERYRNRGFGDPGLEDRVKQSKSRVSQSSSLLRVSP